VREGGYDSTIPTSPSRDRPEGEEAAGFRDRVVLCGQDFHGPGTAVGSHGTEHVFGKAKQSPRFPGICDEFFLRD